MNLKKQTKKLFENCNLCSYGVLLWLFFFLLLDCFIQYRTPLTLLMVVEQLISILFSPSNAEWLRVWLARAAALRYVRCVCFVLFCSVWFNDARYFVLLIVAAVVVVDVAVVVAVVVNGCQMLRLCTDAHNTLLLMFLFMCHKSISSPEYVVMNNTYNLIFRISSPCLSLLLFLVGCISHSHSSSTISVECAGTRTTPAYYAVYPHINTECKSKLLRSIVIC